MPLGTREVLVAIRARDVTSRILREIGNNFGGLGSKGQEAANKLFNTGAALTAIGVGMAGVGAAGIKFFDDSINSFIEYNKQASLTKTQVDQVGVSVSDLERIGKRVASKIPAPFEEMQTALYDIFSSMDVNVQESEQLLAQFSRGAVAGQTDVQTAARGTISILNAYKLPVSDVNRVMDTMFQLVRKGVGTYEEFNSSIGRAIPAAVSAGQSFETLAGMMAFLTRNGLSTQMAATSAARAMELFADPKRFKKLEGIGVTVRDANGRFLQMTDIIEQLANNQAWAKMTEPERKEMFKEIFGQGTIQARRFFDLAIPNYQEFQGLTDDMIGSSGALGQAYETMFDTPAMKAQLLANKYEILKTEIGEQLLPAKIRLMEILTDLLDRWNALDDGTKNLIIRFVTIGTVFLTVVGVVLTMVGAMAMLVAVVAPIVGGIGAAVGLFAVLAAGIAVAIAAVYALVTGNRALLAVLAIIAFPITAIIAIVYVLITAWEEVKEVALSVWNAIKDAASTAWQKMQQFWDWLTGNAVSIWHDIHGAVVTFWGIIQGLASWLWQNFQSIWDDISGAAVSAWHAIQSAGETFWGWIQDFAGWFWGTFGPDIMRVWNSIKEGVSGVIEEIIETFASIGSKLGGAASELLHIITVFGKYFLILIQPASFAIGWIITNFKAFFQVVLELITTNMEILLAIWRPVWDIIWGVVQIAWDIVVTAVTHAMNVTRATIEVAVGIILAFWRHFGDSIWNILQAAFTLMTTIVSSAFTIISNIIQFFLNLIQGDWGEAWENIKNIFGAAWDAIWAALQYVWTYISEFFIALPGNLIGFIGDVASLLWQKGWDILNGLWDGIKNIWESVSQWFIDLPGNIADVVGNVARLLYDKGKDILGGLWDGIKEKWNDAADWIRGLKDRVVDIIKDIFNISSPSRVMVPLGIEIVAGVIKGLVTSTDALVSAVRAVGMSAADAARAVFGEAYDFMFGSGITGGIEEHLRGLQGTNREIGRQIAARYGWGDGTQWNSLNALVMSESGWNNTAQNPTSTAYGIGQFLNSTWSTVGGRKTSDPALQIEYMMRYIAQRYGNPGRAWAFKQMHNYYEQGAWNILNDQLAFLHKGEMVAPRGTAELLRSLGTGGAGRQEPAGQRIGVYVENLYVRDTNVVDDLDFFTRSQNTGV